MSKPYKQGIKVRSLDDYATLLLQLSGFQEKNLVVQLMDKNENAVQEVRMEDDGSAQFFYVTPGVYYVRAFVDQNGNGLWDTGNYDADLQPEDVYYYPKEIEAKAKWDLTKQWNLTERPRNHQKPGNLRKSQGQNKNKRQQRNRNAERAKQLGIEYVKGK